MTRNFIGHQQFQSLQHPNFVELYVVDFQPIDKNVAADKRYLRFTNWTPESNSSVLHDGEEYFPIPMQAEGFEMTTQGVPPSPKITISNIGLGLTGLINEWNDMIGAKLIRKRILREALDDGASPDPNARWPDEVWYIEIKEAENKLAVTFGLATPFELDGVVIPRRRALRHTCPFAYRSEACGYTGAPYWGIDNQALDRSDPSVNVKTRDYMNKLDSRFNAKIDLENLRRDLANARNKLNEVISVNWERQSSRFSLNSPRYYVRITFIGSTVIRSEAFWDNNPVGVSKNGQYRIGAGEVSVDSALGRDLYYRIEEWAANSADVSAAEAEVNRLEGEVAAAQQTFDFWENDIRNAETAWQNAGIVEPLDRCAKNVQACRLRFGKYGPQSLRFGGFPGLLLANPN